MSMSILKLSNQIFSPNLTQPRNDFVRIFHCGARLPRGQIRLARVSSITSAELPLRCAPTYYMLYCVDCHYANSNRRGCSSISLSPFFARSELYLSRASEKRKVCQLCRSLGGRKKNQLCHSIQFVKSLTTIYFSIYYSTPRQI